MVQAINSVISPVLSTKFFDLITGELFIRRHLEVVVLVGGDFDDERLVGFSRDESRAGVTAGFPTGPRVKVEIGFELLGTFGMAFVTMCCEKRTNVGFEIVDAFVGARR